ncbi:hypothetical protein [Parapedobacter soli]|uniref:hypothetical protein n=1 Tax=Parapedobacter soli TaxID=416955 RepID=UPI0021C63B1D|nr:hypothetical protein [Parapedobacter soli]
MTKKIRIGMSAMVAFALMFTSSINVVAQEKVVASDNVEVAESVKAVVLPNTVQKLKPTFEQLEQKKAEIDVMKEPSLKEGFAAKQTNEYWFAVSPDGTIGAYLGKGSAGEASLPQNCGLGLDALCGIMLTDEDVTETTEDEFAPNIANVLEDEGDIEGDYQIRHRPDE